MRVVTLINEKGGTGKTTLATTLGCGLAIQGYTVLLIDADPQGHAGLVLGVPKERGFYDLIVRDADFADVVRDIPDENIVPEGEKLEGKLYVVPGNVESRGVAINSDDRNFQVLKAVSRLDGIVDYVIFDTSPTPSDVHELIYMATDIVLYPSELEYLSLDGLNESLMRVSKANELRQLKQLPPVFVGGIIPNKAMMRTLEHTDSIKEIIDAFGREKVWQPITHRVAWKEAARFHKSIFAYEPDGMAAKNAWKMIERFLQIEGKTLNVQR